MSALIISIMNLRYETLLHVDLVISLIVFVDLSIGGHAPLFCICVIDPAVETSLNLLCQYHCPRDSILFRKIFMCTCYVVLLVLKWLISLRYKFISYSSNSMVLSMSGQNHMHDTYINERCS